MSQNDSSDGSPHSQEDNVTRKEAASGESMSAAIPLLFVPQDGFRNRGQGHRTAVGSHVQRVIRLQRQASSKTIAGPFIEEAPQSSSMKRKPSRSVEGAPVRSDDDAPRPNRRRRQGSAKAEKAAVDGTSVEDDDDDDAAPSVSKSSTSTGSQASDPRPSTSKFRALPLRDRKSHRGSAYQQDPMPTFDDSGEAAGVQVIDWSQTSRRLSDYGVFHDLLSGVHRSATLGLPLDGSLPPSLPVHSPGDLVSKQEAWAMLQKCMQSLAPISSLLSTTRLL